MAQGFMIARYTGVGVAMNIAFAPNYAWVLHQVRLHMNAVGGAVENLTITNDGGVVAAVYDTLFLTQPMAAVQDLVWTPDVPTQFDRLDVLDIVYANSNQVTWGIEIVFTMKE